MKFVIQDTYSLYKKILNIPNEERSDYFKNKLMEPFLKAFELMNMPVNPEAMGCLPITGHDTEMNEMLDKLKNAEAWSKAYDALQSSVHRFQQAGVTMVDKLILGIFLGNPENPLLANVEGYSGFGSMPGYIQIVIAPNEYNLPRLQAVTAHEFHHNVLFTNVKWNFMNVSVAKYLAVEGLAESFAASLYGAEYIGPWVTSVKGQDLEKSREIIGRSLNIQGFNEVRKYIYGDQMTNFNGSEPTGIPAFAGYAVGYHAVQAFLKKTGVTIEKATLIDGETIMEESGYFK
ncbi:MAG: DUF2268 domain-containing putative Zn-dependent protease [Clostridiaceae bacterium]